MKCQMRNDTFVKIYIISQIKYIFMNRDKY